MLKDPNCSNLPEVARVFALTGRDLSLRKRSVKDLNDLAEAAMKENKRDKDVTAIDAANTAGEPRCRVLSDMSDSDGDTEVDGEDDEAEGEAGEAEASARQRTVESQGTGWAGAPPNSMGEIYQHHLKHEAQGQPVCEVQCKHSRGMHGICPHCLKVSYMMS